MRLTLENPDPMETVHLWSGSAQIEIQTDRPNDGRIRELREAFCALEINAVLFTPADDGDCCTCWGPKLIIWDRLEEYKPGLFTEHTSIIHIPREAQSE